MKLYAYLLTFALCWTVAATAPNGAMAKPEDDDKEYIEVISNIPWLQADYSQIDFPGKDGLQMCKTVLDNLEKAKLILKRKYPEDRNLDRHLNQLTLPPADKLHEKLGRLKGRQVDVIGTMHHSSFDVPGTLMDAKLTVDCQLDVADIIVRSEYEVVFTEIFSRDAGVLTPQSMKADLRRDYLARRDFCLDAELASRIDSEVGRDASLTISKLYPNIKLIGSDYAEAKQALCCLMEKWTSVNGENMSDFDAVEQFVIRSLCEVRDLIALVCVAGHAEFSNKPCVIVYGSLHSQHMAMLLTAYGAKGSVSIPDYEEWKKAYAGHSCFK